MSLDKAIWQTAMAQYQAWNDDVLADQVLHPDRRTPAEKWHAYQDLYAFGRQIRPEPSEWEHTQTGQAWSIYYERILQFEEWRRQRGRTS